MSTKTTAAANADLDSKYGNNLAGGYYVAALDACTALEAAAGTVVEKSGGSYARKPISFAAAAARAKASNAEIDMGEADFDHGDIGAWGIYAASSGGTPVHVIRLAVAIPFDTGYQPKIASGDLSITEGAYA